MKKYTWGAIALYEWACVGIAVIQGNANSCSAIEILVHLRASAILTK